MTQLILPHPSDSAWEAVRHTVQHSRDFPILAESRARLRQQLQSSQVNFDDLATTVEQDPALCLHLLINTVAHNPACQEQISGAASCLSLLGMKELVRLIKHLPVVTANESSRPHQLYRRALHCSAIAGALAAHWSTAKTGAVSYIRWSSLLVSAPLWLWLLKEERAQNWFYCLSTGQELIPALDRCFGIEQQANWLSLAEQLALPQAALNCYQPQHWLNHQQWQWLRRYDPRDLDTTSVRKLLHQLQQPHIAAIMANTLAWHWHISPLGRGSQRWLAIVSHWLGKPLSHLLGDLRRIQLHASHVQQDGLASGLALLLSPTVCRMHYPAVDPQPAAASHQTAEPSTDLSACAQRHADNAYLQHLTEQLQQHPDSFGDWHELMRYVLKGICQGVGLSSAGIALLNKDKTLLKMFYVEGVVEGVVEGMEKNDPIRRVSIDLRTPNVFRKLLEKPTSLLIEHHNRHKFLRGLSTNNIRQLPAQFAAMSIDAGHHPIGVVFGYNNQGEKTLSREEFQAFKNLCRVASHSLMKLRHKTRKPKSSKPETSG